MRYIKHSDGYLGYNEQVIEGLFSYRVIKYMEIAREKQH